MVKKKSKITKKGRKRSLKEDVHATTSLPPSVEGQLRCFLRVSISKIVWLCAKPPDTTHVRLRWWGEITEGSVFRPLDVKNPQKTVTRTVARYPVRCGPKQFAAYLTDMGTLILDVLKGANMQPIGKAQMNEIGHLAPQVPINGFYSVFSTKSADKIAELLVSLVFEPLPASYDSSGSIPTTDLSVATAGTGTTAESSSIQSQPVRTGPPLPVPRPHRVISSSSDDPFMSPIPKVPHHPRHSEPKQIITPRGVDTDYSFVIGPGKVDDSSDHGKKEKTATQTDTGLQTAPVRASYQPRRDQSSDTDHALPTAKEVETMLGTQQGPRHTGSTAPVPPVQRHLNPSSRPGSDLISALLDRGTKLRDDMIKSELDPGTSAVKGTLDGISPGIPRKIGTDVLPGPVETRPLKRRSSGELFREILRTDDAHQPTLTAHTQEIESSHDNRNTDAQTIELLIGEKLSAQELNELQTLQSELSPQSSVSSESDAVSETEDPLRDHSILEELFYKGGRSSSESSLSDLLSSDDDDSTKKPKESSSRRRRWSYESSLSDPGNQRPPSRNDAKPSSDDSPMKHPKDHEADKTVSEERESRKTERMRRRERAGRGRRHHGSQGTSEATSSESEAGSTSRMSEGSRVSFQEPLIAEKQGDGLSVQRLTLLGRVHIARVMIDSLTLKTPVTPSIGREERRPSRGGRGRGRPPRPSQKLKTKKCTYFVEYHFPVAASPRQKSLITSMATEVMRLVSKKVDNNGEVTFGHRSVFPVNFDGSVVDCWWKQLLVFKIFSRSAGQKTPVLLGVASLPLRSVLQSPDLSLLNLVLDAKDKQQSSTGAESSTDGALSDTMIGTLKMSIELASDSKDFPMALARMKVAEMKGTQIVPLPSNKPYLPIKIPTGSIEDSDTKSSSRSIQTDHVSTQGLDGTSSGVDGALATSRTHTETRHTDTKASLHHCDKEQIQEVDQKHQGPDREQRVDRQLESKHQDGLTSETKPDYEARTLHSLLLIPEGRAVTVHGVSPLKSSSSHIPNKPAPQAHPGTGHGISGLAYGRDQTTRNTYLVCRLFWSDDSVRSNVCWGTTEPVYNFMQVSPVLLTPSLLERARNNCMVIEVWDKKTSAQNDQLVGIAKLPLHQFYMSFRDERIARTLLKTQYPVAAVDNYVNIVDPFTGIQYGQLKILLALGSSEQISSLQRLKCDMDHMDSIPQRPGHYLERGEAVVQNVTEQQPSKDEQVSVEHLFEVVVEGIRGLPQLEDTVWGEADCFIQYHFPSQSQPKAKVDGITPLTSGPVLMPHQTPITLCMPDLTFHDVSRHRLQLPRGTPVQRELLTACAGVGGGAGGLPFDVWCRYYYPNVRDQVVAKASLPLAKLCGMVTMQRRGEPSIQTFSLPLKLLHPDQESLTKEQIAKIPDAGLLDVTVNYQHKVVQAIGSSPRIQDIGGPQVCLSVSILRACGLKHAAKSLAKYDSSLQYPSEVGVNAYVKMALTFLSKEDIRITQTVARTFAPEFSHHVDFPCPLLFNETESDHLSLAEALETAEMTLQVWHQVPAFKSGHDVNVVPGTGMSARRLYAPTGDILLATTTISLHSLLSHSTGIQGWYPISLPSPAWSSQPSADVSSSPRQGGFTGLERVAGGLELAIKFAHEGDRSRVIDAGRRVGWSPDTEHEMIEDLWNDKDGTTGSYSADINIHIDSAWFPVHTALRPGQHALDTAAKAYIRYKLYDRGSVCSKLCYLDVNEDNYIAANLRHSEHIHIALTQSLAWYLREESLEIQLWVSYSRDLSSTDTGQQRPRQRDKLIGCAYMDMSTLCDQRMKQHRISGLYPVFRPGASDLGGSCIRAHLSLKPIHGDVHRQQDSSSEEADLHSRPIHPSTHHQHPKYPPRHPSKTQGEALDSEEAGRTLEDVKRQQEEEEEAMKHKKSLEPVLMTVAVERAMHLATVRCNHKLEDCLPSCYVTFQTAAGSLVYTATIASTDQPMWAFEQEVRISSQVLDRQSFIFKVWHQTSSQPDMNSDRMLGFASVDLAPLLAGFRSLNGWYNILDFSGHCKGQIKVSITPRESVSPLKHSPKAKTTPNTSAIFAQAFPNAALATSPRHISSQSQQPPKEATTQPPSNHYQEHLQNIRKFHADLHDRLRAQQLDSTTAEQGRDGEKGIRIPGVGLPSTVSGSFLMQNLRRNLEELEMVQQGLQQKLTSQDHWRVSTAQHESNQSNEPSQEYREKTQGSSDIAGSSSRDMEYDGTGLMGGAAGRDDEDILQKVRDELQQADAEYQSIDADYNESDGPIDNHDLGSDDAAQSQMLESDWEDSMQFQYGKADEGSDRETDVILPRPLNDVSSAYFSNGIRPDAILTGTREPERELHESGWHKSSDTSTRHKVADEVDSRSKIESKDTSNDQDDEHDLNYHRSDSEKPPMDSNLDSDNDGLIGDALTEGNGHAPSLRSTWISKGSHVYDHNQMADKNETQSNKIPKTGSNNQTVVSDLRTDQSLETKREQEASEGTTRTHDSQIDQPEDLNQADPMVGSFGRTDSSAGWEPEADRFLGQESDDRTGPGQDERDEGSLQSSSDESVVITIDSRQAEKQSRSRTTSQPSSAPVHQPFYFRTKSTPAQLPNFFLPAQDLEASMRALHNITSVLPRAQAIQITDHHDEMSKPTAAARELTGRLASTQPSSRPQERRPAQKPAYKLPTAEEARRIAKIFASRYTES